MHAVTGRWWRYATVASLALAGLLFALARERDSVERGNRLHRSGALPQAAAIYRGRTDPGSPRPELRYNLGTTLLELGSSGAEPELVVGTASTDEEVRAPAFYNLGVSRLLRAGAAESGDSMRIHARASVEANRSTLRLESDQPDAKWNLSMAQRMLDSLDAAERRRGRVTAEGPGDSDELVPAENTIEGDQDDPTQGDAPLEGEDEARAEIGDEAPLSLAEAIEILEATRLDGAQIMRKLLALESRARWGRQIGKVGPKR